MKGFIFKLIINIVYLILSKEEEENYYSEITITINGTGFQPILSDSKDCKEIPSHFDNFPDEILINGVQTNVTREVNIDNSQIKNNKITMRWKYPLTSCNNMFKDLTNIIDFDFSKFDTSKVTEMKCMFSNCSKITSFNLNKFNTSLVNNMQDMFSDCENLTQLDLYNFDTSKVTDFHHFVYQCYNLTSINLKSFDTSKVINMTGMFGSCYSLYSLDLNNFNTSSVTTMWAMFNLCSKLIYLDLRNFDTSSVIDMDTMFKDCCSLKYLNLNNFKTNKVYRKYDMFKNVSNSLIFCMDETKGAEIISLLYNFINNCSFLTYFNYSQKFIINKNLWIDECFNDDKYKYEFNGICYEYCPKNTNISYNKEYLCEKINNFTEECEANDFFNGKCKVASGKIEANSKDKDNMIENIKNSIKNGTMDSFISNILEGENYIVKEDDLIYQITSTTNQNENKINNISTIIIGECEKILKRQYNISEDLALLIFKIDYFKQGALIPIIGYEIYHPITKIKLDLNYCNNASININIPVSINEDNLLKYDPNNQYYTDECIPSTTENGTDILLNDRQIEFNNNNMSLCENGCTYNGYINKTVKCECNFKYKQIIISELIDDKNVLTYNFTNKNDMITMKCYNTLFTKEGLVKNIGSYLLLFIILIIASSGIIFYKCGYYLVIENIKEIESMKNRKEKEIRYSVRKSKKKKPKSKRPKINSLDNKSFSKKNLNKIDSEKSKTILKKSKIVVYNINGDYNYFNDFNNCNNYENYNDYELNSLSYKNAILIDKRNFSSYYLSLVRTKHPLLFAFWPIKDYNSRIVKINLFIISISIYYFINSLFFNESLIHKIYKDEGIYNLIYQIPCILYSFIISHTLNIFIKFIFLSERNIYKIRNETDNEKLSELISNVKNCLVIKYICFYCIFFSINIFFWYYLSSFGAVYQNTQIYLIKNTLFSFAFSMIYPFLFNLLPPIFRIYSIRNANKEFQYKISKIIQLI